MTRMISTSGRGTHAELLYDDARNAKCALTDWPECPNSVRYAAPPVGKLRWQAPQRPHTTNCRGVTPAVEHPPVCPQSGAYGTPAVYGFNSGPGDEDCLYLNVYAAPNASALPVLVWIRTSP